MVGARRITGQFPLRLHGPEMRSDGDGFWTRLSQPNGLRLMTGSEGKTVWHGCPLYFMENNAYLCSSISIILFEDTMSTRFAHSTHLADSHWMLVAALALINVVLLLVF